uniref:Reverse transcriptase/retrotransposon-derived protein RNase H-like domain-containing protein n=1 Tax=Solanum lycopersicum TaxID=4081 RepID=A0A3Q7I1T9_SOLLC
MERLSKACWFIKLDLRAGYWQMIFRTLEEHVNHLSLVLSQLRKYTLYVKMENFEFAKQKIKFLGHLVSKNQAPRHLKDLRLFLGLDNYYRKFITGYSKRVTTLTDLLKKDTKWVWSERCDEAFQNLKEAIASEPILKLPDFQLPFEVHTDASDKEIGGFFVTYITANFLYLQH